MVGAGAYAISRQVPDTNAEVTMHWVLVFILFGQSARPTIDTSLRFSTGAACLAARDAIMVDISGPGRLVCVKDGADPVDKAVDNGISLPVKNPPKQ